VTRVRTCQGGSCLVGGLLESLQLILEKEYVEYIIIFFTNIKNPLVNILPARTTTKILFKVLFKKQTMTGRNAF